MVPSDGAPREGGGDRQGLALSLEVVVTSGSSSGRQRPGVQIYAPFVLLLSLILPVVVRESCTRGCVLVLECSGALQPKRAVRGTGRNVEAEPAAKLKPLVVQLQGEVDLWRNGFKNLFDSRVNESVCLVD
ncbi:hypothetical protein R1sor_008924 [Riccia sorocarpa]|uniref:Uncharacterized protein n=1 Tax=Riccia sorocarpa TaxID=122646 RepID=A0ABD3H7K4_9MARC